MARRLISFLLWLVLMLAPGAALADQVRMAVVTKPGSSQNVCADNFAMLLDKSSQGQMKTKVFHSGSQGDENRILCKLRQGKLDMCVVTTGVFDSVAPQVRAVEFPFLFENYDQVDKVLQGTAGRQLLNSLKGSGLRGLAFSENGFRNLTNNKRPVIKVADVKGLIIRVMESKLQTTLWRKLGAVPVPHPWPMSELLASEQVDGQENPLGVIWTYRLDKLQKHLSLTRHVYSAHICAANPAWFNSLPKSDQKLVAQAAKMAAAYQRGNNRRRVYSYLAKLENAGMQVVKHPELDSFKAKVADFSATPLFDCPQVMKTLKSFKKALKN